MYRALSLGLAFWLLLTGCGGGGSTTAHPVAPSAVQLQAAYDPAKVLITLTWVPPAEPIDGYNLEVRIGTGEFNQLNPTLITATANSILLSFTSTPPELMALGFRLYAVRSGLRAPYSNTCEIRIPLNAPTFLAASFSAPLGGVSVTWDTPSLVADRYVLERATCDAAGTVAGPWTPLALGSPLATSCLDTDVSETQHYRYRVTAWAGNLASTTTDPALPVAIPPLAPAAFAAQALPGAVGLTWVNRSQTATQIQITRGLPNGEGGTLVLATLPATATAFQDSGLTLGYYAYGICVSDGLNVTAGPALLAAPANPPEAPRLTATAQTPCQYLAASALSPGGLWAFGTINPFAVLPAPWGAWPMWSPADLYTLSQAEFLCLDAQSLPHALYPAPTASATLLTHAWFDGTAWNTEAIAQAPSPGTLLASPFCLDPAGSPQTVLYTDTGLFYTRKVAGTWIQEALDPSNTLSGTAHLCLDPAGTPHVLLVAPADTREFTRNADGTWTSQILPNPLAPGELCAFEEGVWADGDTAWVFYKVPDATRGSNDAFWVMQKVSGAWQPPVLLKSFSATGLAGRASVALSADGTRIVAVCGTGNGLFLYTLGAQGWIESLLPVPAQDSPYLKAAFDGANRLHILVKPSIDTGDLVDAHE